MPRQSPNPLQKLVRGVLRDLIDQANSQNPDKTPKRKTKKSTATRSKSEPKPTQGMRSRHIPASVRVSVLHRDSYKCVFCGRGAKQVQLEVDHIIPFSKDGSNDLSNLQTLCFDCNRGKGTRHLT
jgi:5-methylcytosine-specific restriction endonuclease McrA